MSKSEAVGGPKNTAYYINSLITVVLMIGIGFLPAPDPMTPMGMKVLGIFIGALYGWTTVNTVWPSILVLTLLGMSGFMPVKDAFMQAFGNDTVLFLLFLYVFCYVIDTAGITKYFAAKLIGQKFIQGKPWLLAGMIFVAAYICSALTSVVASMILCWSMIYSMVEKMGYQKKEAYPTILIIGVTYFAIMGYTAMPFKLGFPTLAGLVEQMTGLSVDPLKYLIMGLWLSILLLIVWVLFCKFVLRPDVSKCLAAGDINGDTTAEKLDGRQKLILSLMGLMIVLMLLPSVFMGSQNAFIQMLNSVGLTAIVALFDGLFIFLRYQGKPLIDYHAAFKHGIYWDVIFLLGAAMVLSKGLTSETTGIQAALKVLFNPILSGHGTLIFMLLSLGIALIFTNFCNNFVVMVTLLPIMATFSNEIGGNFVVFALALQYMCATALLTPAASPMAAVMHGNDWLDKKAIYRMVLEMMLVTYLVTIILFVPFGNQILFR